MAIIKNLDRECVDTSYLNFLTRKTTGTSVVLLDSKSGERTILTCRGASEQFGNFSVEQHEKEWNQIFAGIHDVVDAVAFQDGHIDYDELDAFFSVNKKLADKYGMKCWTNAETFDRDMPINFLPIKFDKLRLKLEAAKRCGYDKAITFEFPHFMSPQSVYGAAGNLYNRYKEYFNIK